MFKGNVLVRIRWSDTSSVRYAVLMVEYWMEIEVIEAETLLDDYYIRVLIKRLC